MSYSGRSGRQTSARRALYRQQDLEQRLTTLIAYTKRYYAPDLKAELALAQADAAVVSRFFSENLETKVYNERRPPHATDIAARAFALPEILEMILNELGHNELLNSQLVSRQFRDTIKASPNLRFRISPPRSKVKKRNGPRINIDGNVPGVELMRECRFCKEARWYDETRRHRHCTKEVRVKVEDCERMIPWRCLNMQICEPHIHDMKIFITCRCVPEYDGDYEPEPFGHVSNEHGITLRDLLDKARDLRAEHVSCEQTPYGRTKGFKWTPDDMKVTFTADHGFICEECSKRWQCCDPQYSGDSEPDSDDDTHTDEEDEEYDARLQANKMAKRKADKIWSPLNYTHSL